MPELWTMVMLRVSFGALIVEDFSMNSFIRPETLGIKSVATRKAEADHTAKWIVHIHGDKPEDEDDEDGCFEISAIRSDNEHGQLSWGWGDETKIILDDIPYDLALELANVIVDHMNHRT